jgi:PIN domain nuclease of toxin-antitoxin system
VTDLLVTDTHALLLHLTGDRKGLGTQASLAFDRADRGEAPILVPVTALLEVLAAVGRGWVLLEDGATAWTARFRAHPGFEVAELSADIVQQAAELSFLPGEANRLIAATTLRHRGRLLTRDPAFARAGVDTVW